MGNSKSINNSNKHVWDDRSISIIKDTTLNNREAAEILGTTYSSVKQKRRSLGITEYAKGIEL